MARSELKASTGASTVGEEDCLDAHRTIEDVQDGDAVSADAVEDQIPTMHPATDAVTIVMGHQRPALWAVGNVEAELVEFAHEAPRPCWVVSGNIIADRFKIRLGLGRGQGVSFWASPGCEAQGMRTSVRLSSG